ncbi:YfdX family protein [Methylomonas methanica]|uniref:YfdX protein n=1 Tax=Methylomonas methanica (strain DSM 25384 / MC09) TaxID=857087 RepID=F9ZVG9_METMM|nr:YfdX family protein [Methylomonas methanica]AEG01951.1 hypothetical protein Metme_3587 [Methylomonas methanica MC09]
MKNTIYPKKPIAVLVAAFLAGAAVPVVQAAQTHTAPRHVIHHIAATFDHPVTVPGELSDQEKQKLMDDKKQQIVDEASEAIIGTHNALLMLESGDSAKARSQLQDVLGKLDILLTKRPGLALIPADVSARIYDLDDSVDQVKKLVGRADDLLGDSRVQDARRILDNLVSEIRLTTVSIPLGTFPPAIKEAIVEIDDQKADQAKVVLADVLGSLVKTTEVYALPVLQAETLLTAAAELEHKADLSKADARHDIMELTDAAKDKLKLSQLLGYGTDDDYADLYDSIDGIDDVIRSERSAAVWDKVKQRIAHLEDSIKKHL